MAAIRQDGDAQCATHTYVNYYQAYSSDGGLTWTTPRPMEGTGCARPKLLRLSDGPLLLSGGRLCVENTTGIFLWVNDDGLAGLHGGDGRGQWARYSLPYWHDRLWAGNASYRFGPEVNDSDAFATLAYTSLIQTGPREGAVLYNKFFSPRAWPPWPSANFLMRFRFDA